MPATLAPNEGAQGFWALLNALKTRILNLELALRQSSAIVVPGTITRWPGASAPPGALACNGATFSPVTYPQLAAAIGATTLPNISGTPIYVIWTGPPSSLP